MGSPHGPYEEYYKRILERCAASSDARGAGARGQRDFVARTAYDSLRIRKLLEICLQPASGGVAPEWNDWQSQLLDCLAIKPDLDFMGWMSLPESKWRDNFGKDDKTFLKHMFEKHHGEIIYVKRTVYGSVPMHNELMLHHPQFFVGNTVREREARSNAKAFFKSACGDPLARKEFFARVRTVSTEVFVPVSDDHCSIVDVAYFSLPALVFELFTECTLCDIYTFFCRSKLLACKAPHPTVAAARIDAARMRFEATGRYGFGR